MLPVRLFKNRVDGFLPESRNLLARWPTDIDDLFGHFFGTCHGGGFQVDVREDGDNLIVEAELPGLSKEDIEITVEDGILTIAGELKSKTDQDKPNYHLRERRYGRVLRSFSLPTTVDGEKVNANLANGVLTVSIPKREEVKPRRIEVK